MWQSWFNLAIGIWLIFCGFTPSLQTPTSMVVPGALAFVFGFWTTTRIKNFEGPISGMAGVWLFLSAVWFHFYLPWNFFLIGGIITVLTIWNLTEHPDPSSIPHPAK